MMSPNPVSIDEAYRTFLTLLSLNDVSVVEDGKYTLIMADKDIISTKIPWYDQDKLPNTFRLAATIIKLQYAPAQEIEKVLKIFRDKSGTSVIFDDKTIIVVDYAANLRQMLGIIKQLDAPSETDSVSLHFLKLEHIAPTDAKKLLDEIFRDYAKKAGASKSKTQSGNPVIGGISEDGSPEQPVNQPQTEKKDDTPEGSVGSEMYMHIVADDRSEQLIVLCNKTTFSLMLQVMQRIDRKLEGEGEVHVIPLQNAKAVDLAKTLTTLSKNTASKSSSAGKKPNEIFEGDVQISANEATNALVVVSSIRDFRNLKKVIEQLDIKRKQVFIEAIILELNVSEDIEYGLNFGAGGFETTIGGKKVPIFFGKSMSGSTAGLMAGLLGPALAGTENLSGGIPGIGFPSLGLMVHASKKDDNSNVMATPHITTTDNEEAEIIVGETIPFPSANIISSTAGSQMTYKREDVALKLKIKPRINDGGYMTLEVDTEITEVSGQSDYGLTTSKRSAKTIVNAENEQTIVIGGLMKDKITEVEHKIPLLGDIPVLGSLFKHRSKGKNKVNLLIILTPHIIESKKDYEAIYKKKIDEREEFAKKFYGDIKDYESKIMVDKKKGVLLSIAQGLDYDRVQKEESIEKEKQMKKNPAVMITPDGKEESVDMDKKKESVPEIDEKKEDSEDELIDDIIKEKLDKREKNLNKSVSPESDEKKEAE